MKKILYLLVGLICLIDSCTSDEIADYQPTVVVEGWIENGKAPIVSLTRMVPVESNFNDQNAVIQNTINDAEVCIICEGRSYQLEHKIDSRFSPCNIYTTEEIKGEEGKSYQLNIKTTSGEELTATTKIPPAAIIEDISAEAQDKTHEQYTLYIQLKDDLSERHYYKAFVHIGETLPEDFHSSFLGEYDNTLFNSVNPRLPIYSYKTSKQEHFNPYFSSQSVVEVKFCSVDSIAYHYWNEYAKMLELSRNPIFTYRNNLPTNIHGGIGYWFGYGAVRCKVNIP